MKAIRIISLLLGLSSFFHGVAGNDPVGGRYVGMGGVSVIADDIWAAFHNQAGLGFVQQAGAGVALHNSYGLPELNSYKLAIVLPTGRGTFGLSHGMTGDEFYNRSKTGLAYGMRLSPKTTAGVQMDMLQTRLGMDYGQRTLFTVEAGIISEIHNGLFASAHIFNPVRAKLAEYADERLPSSMSFGLLWKISEKTGIAAELHKEETARPVFKAGIEFMPVEGFFLRGGMNAFTAEAAFGLGYKTGKIHLDFSSVLHPQLGLSHHLSAAFSFGKIRK